MVGEDASDDDSLHGASLFEDRDDENFDDDDDLDDGKGDISDLYSGAGDAMKFPHKFNSVIEAHKHVIQEGNQQDMTLVRAYSTLGHHKMKILTQEKGTSSYKDILDAATIKSGKFDSGGASNNNSSSFMFVNKLATDKGTMSTPITAETAAYSPPVNKKGDENKIGSLDCILLYMSFLYL